MKKLLALLMAFTLTIQLVTPVFAEEIEETRAATEAAGAETEAPVTEIPTTEPPTTEVSATEPPTTETAALEETSEPTEPQTITEATEVTEVTEATASTEETTAAITEPTEETTEPALDLFADDENVIASGECGADGDNLTWTLNIDGTLTISGTGRMANYTNYTQPWRSNWSEILSAVVEDGVTGIGDCAFQYCRKLASATIPADVTSIGYAAFGGCDSLTGIVVNSENAAYTSIDGVLFDNAKTTLVCYPSGHGTTYQIPEGVTTIGDAAFSNCSYLTGVEIPNSVRCIGNYAFNTCSNLTTIEIPDSVTSIGKGAFSTCIRLTGIVIPKNVTSISDFTFLCCYKLASVEISSGVTSIGNRAFCSCDSLTSIEIPECVESIGWEAFSDCDSLTSIVIPKNVTSVGIRAFSQCTSLANVEIPDSMTSIADGTFSGCRSLTDIKIPKSITSIGDSAFVSCTGLTHVEIPESVTSIGGFVFHGCNRLVRINIPEGVTSIREDTFSDCSSLTSIIIPKRVTSIGVYAFSGCTSLTRIVIPKGVIRISNNTFSGCTRLTNIAIPKSVTDIAYLAFDNCPKLKAVYYGGSEADWNNIRVSYGNSALDRAKIHFNSKEEYDTEIRPADVESLSFGSKLTLTAWIMPEKTKVSARWSLAPGDEAYASITSAGVLTAKAVDAVQEITVIATPLDGSPEATKTIRILPQVKEIALFVDGVSAPSTLSPDMYERTTLDFYAEVQPEGARTDVTWSSNNPKVAAVAADGTVTLLKPGTAVIKAAAADGSKVSAQVTLNVTYTDHSPKLGASALNLNTAYSLGTTVDFVERLENRVEIVSVNDDRFDVSYEDNRLTLKAQEPGLKGTYKLTLETVCADGRTYSYPLTVKASTTLPKLTVKQTEKFDLFYQDSRAVLTISGGEVEEAELIGTNDFVLGNEDGAYVIRYADPGDAPEKPDTKATLSVTFAGYNTPVTKALTISTVNTTPKIKLNPTSSILNTNLKDWTVEPTILGTTDESLEAWTTTEGVDAFIEEGVLHVTLSTPKTTTATLYFRVIGSWAKSVRVTHKITVTSKQPAVKFTAKGKLDVLNPESEIVYTPKLTNATGTITDVRLEGQDANLFNAEVADGLVHLSLVDGGEYATRKTYKITPVVTLLGNEIEGPTLSVKVTQSALKLAKIPNQTASKSKQEPLTVNLTVTSPATAKIGDVQLNAKTTAAFRNALEAADGIQTDGGIVTFPAETFKHLNPGKYTVILDVTPSNAVIDAKPIQAKFPLTVQK